VKEEESAERGARVGGRRKALEQGIKVLPASLIPPSLGLTVLAQLGSCLWQ
jgi:hypothetical protein